MLNMAGLYLYVYFGSMAGLFVRCTSQWVSKTLFLPFFDNRKATHP